jgi:ectoine hydroxylase-related dioxygenase (phytanoyl-CoA dioxygenase family)
VSIDAEVIRHPWNTSFAWTDHTPPFRRVSPEQARQFHELGFFVMEDVFPAEVIAAVRDAIDGYEAELEQLLRRQENDRIMIAEAGAITFTTHLVTRSPRLRSFAADPVFAELCIDLVGPDANLYWDQAVYKKPEKPRRFPWHQDNGYTFVEPQQYLTCWVALTDATVDNGCPQVAPGLHRLGTLAHTYVDPLGFECFAAPEQVMTAPVRAGGMVVFSSLTPHLTGPNVTAAVRKAYILQYAPAGARIQQGDPGAGPPTGEVSADNPDRQFAVARDGRPVPA